MNIDFPTPDLVPALRALWKEAFGDGDAFLDMFFTTAFSPERSRCITANARVTAALYWFDCLFEGGRIAYIYAVATAKDMRGHGLCRALMDDTHRHLSELGYNGAILVPGDRTLFSLYEKMGYRTSAYIDEIKVDAGETAVGLCEISKEEYALLRRQILPGTGVIQEGVALDFLEKQAVFYKGGGLILAARKEGNTLFAAEYLGQRADMASVVRSLGCESGKFRTPGKGSPFAMYRHFGNDLSPTPTYFAFAFD